MPAKGVSMNAQRQAVSINKGHMTRAPLVVAVTIKADYL